MANKYNRRWVTLKVLAVFAVAFLLQGMSLAIFRDARPAGKADRSSQETTRFGGPLFASKTFTVTTTEDGGPGSLRQAILEANENPGLDVIHFAFSEPVTITLNADLPLIMDPVSMEAPGPWITDTVPGWLTIDGSNLEASAALFDILDAAGTSIRRLLLINPSGYGFRIADGPGGSEMISNTVRNSAGGILLRNTGQITAAHNAFLDMTVAAVSAEGSHDILLQENIIQNVFEGDGFRLLGGVRNAIVITNSLSGIGGAGVWAAATDGAPAPTGVLIRGNSFTDTGRLIFLGPGANGGFPAPEILNAFLGRVLRFSARSPADPITYTYPLSMDLYRVRNGNYSPLGVTVPYDGFPDGITYTVALSGLLSTDQIALIATTANPGSSEFSPPAVLSTPPAPDDLDDDGVVDAVDLCPGTVIPEATVPSVRLNTNRFALVDDDLVFDTTPPGGRGPGRSYTTEDTGGCSCEQIIAATGAGNGHGKFGCSIGVMDGWVAGVGAGPKRETDPGAARAAGLPETFSLEQNYPNPFNPQTTITFQVPEQRRVRLRVFDVLGRAVITLVDEEKTAGTYQVQWDGRDARGLPVASGLYLYRMEAGIFSTDKTMILLR